MTTGTQHESKWTPTREVVKLRILATAAAEYQMEADLRGVPLARLMARILEIVAEDGDLFDNILDGELPRKRGAL